MAIVVGRKRSVLNMLAERELATLTSTKIRIRSLRKIGRVILSHTTRRICVYIEHSIAFYRGYSHGGSAGG